MSQVSMQGEYNNNNSISNKLHIKKKKNEHNVFSFEHENRNQKFQNNSEVTGLQFLSFNGNKKYNKNNNNNNRVVERDIYSTQRKKKRKFKRKQ